jgi:hypothetical protein
VYLQHEKISHSLRPSRAARNLRPRRIADCTPPIGFPPGGQSGTTLQVTLEGADLDDLRSLQFSNTGISSERNPTNAAGVFSVTNREQRSDRHVRGARRWPFRYFQPRFFTVDDRTNLVAQNNHAIESAMIIPLENTVNTFATASAADFYKFEAGEPLLIACQAEPFDSKMKPVLILYDSEGREILRDRREGRILSHRPDRVFTRSKFTISNSAAVKQFPYRLTVTKKINLDLPPRLARLPAHDVEPSSILSEQESNDRTAQKIAPPV